MQALPSKELPEKPEQFEKLKELASALSQGIPQVRVEFLCNQWADILWRNDILSLWWNGNGATARMEFENGRHDSFTGKKNDKR